MKRLLILPLLLFFAGSLVAQTFGTPKDQLAPCGVTERSPWIDAYQRGEIAQARTNETMVIPLRLHVVAENDGSGIAPFSRILDGLVLLNQDFATANIKFCIDGDINYINNSNYYDHNFSTGGLMMALNNDAGVINCYLVGDPAGNCGYYSGNQDAIAMAYSCIGNGDHTWGHEMGHLLSLPHTFSGWEGELEGDFNNLPIDDEAPNFVNGRRVELADGSNCEIAGDGFCDTPADYISERWPCISAGIYADSLLDPDSVKFAVQAYPIMGYAFDNCVESFTLEQETAMVTNAMGRNISYDGEVIDEPADASVISLVEPTESSFEAVDEFEVQLRWTSTANADFYIVQINRTQFFGTTLFDEFTTADTAAVISDVDNGLQLNTRYYWRVIPVNNCNVDSDASEFDSFRVTDIISNTIDAELNAAVTLFPNPVSNGETNLLIRATQLPQSDNINLDLIDMQGRSIVRANNLSTQGNSLSYDLPIGNLPNGVYFLRMQQADRLVTRRVVIAQ